VKFQRNSLTQGRGVARGGSLGPEITSSYQKFIDKIFENYTIKL